MALVSVTDKVSMFVLPPTGNGTYCKLERVRIIEVFLEQMYENFVGT